LFVRVCLKFAEDTLLLVVSTDRFSIELSFHHLFRQSSSVPIVFFGFLKIQSFDLQFRVRLQFPFVFTGKVVKNHRNSLKISKNCKKMRTTRQSSTSAESGDMTMQQVMHMMQGLQEAMAASKVEQERMQADLVAS